MSYSYPYSKDYQKKIDQTFEAKLNTKLSLATYEYFGCSGPIIQKQLEEYLALPLQPWRYYG